ncbi:MAG: DUF815 domain-containing protein [Clostridia bacterium]
MRELSSCSCREGVETLFSLLGRLTIIRDAPGAPLDRLMQLTCAFSAGDAALCEHRYHALTTSLLCCPARRVSGDLWRDYVLYLVVQQPNAFSLMAAAQRVDDEVVFAMKHDLEALHVLFRLTDKQLVRMAQERKSELKQKSKQGHDSISLMSTAVWSGSAPLVPAVETPYAQYETPLCPIDFEWAQWHYGEAELRGSYVADEALEEVYMRLISAESWRGMTQDLWNFFAAYGCGDFLRYRLFDYQSGTLIPLIDSIAAPLSGSLYDDERAQLMDNTIRFMRGECADNVLITGGGGTGKTAQVLSLAYELPEVRLVRLNGVDPGNITALLCQLADQPFKIILLLDNMDFESAQIRQAVSRLCACGARPDNVLVYATARDGDAAFPLKLHLPWLQLTPFVNLVIELLLAGGIAADAMQARALSLDAQVDSRDNLSFALAQRVAQQYRSTLI